jgi:hypothetical protein
VWVWAFTNSGFVTWFLPSHPNPVRSSDPFPSLSTATASTDGGLSAESSPAVVVKRPATQHVRQRERRASPANLRECQCGGLAHLPDAVLCSQEERVNIPDQPPADFSPDRFSYVCRHVVIKGRPCKIVDMSTSKTGKHGHAKVHLVAIDVRKCHWRRAPPPTAAHDR